MGCGPVAKYFLSMSGALGSNLSTKNKTGTTITNRVFHVQGVILKVSGEHKLFVLRWPLSVLGSGEETVMLWCWCAGCDTLSLEFASDPSSILGQLGCG